eukprot:5139309-Amphidinium_carterae.1
MTLQTDLPIPKQPDPSAQHHVPFVTAKGGSNPNAIGGIHDERSSALMACLHHARSHWLYHQRSYSVHPLPATRYVLMEAWQAVRHRHLCLELAVLHNTNHVSHHCLI